jgi:hypothetical protein
VTASERAIPIARATAAPGVAALVGMGVGVLVDPEEASVGMDVADAVGDGMEVAVWLRLSVTGGDFVIVAVVVAVAVAVAETVITAPIVGVGVLGAINDGLAVAVLLEVAVLVRVGELEGAEVAVGVPVELTEAAGVATCVCTSRGESPLPARTRQIAISTRSAYCRRPRDQPLIYGPSVLGWDWCPAPAVD